MGMILNAGAVASLVQLCDGTWVNHLWQTAKSGKEEGIAHFVRFYCQLWQALEKTYGEDPGKSRQKALLPYLNALAFGAKGLLPSLWRYFSQARMNSST